MSLAFIIPGAYPLSRPQLMGRRFFNLFIAFNIILLRNFFEAIPRSFEEAARRDDFLQPADFT